jgi:membrane fusion protein (multidrug efflux system)
MTALRRAQEDLRAADFVSVNEARQRFAASQSTAELAQEEKKRLEQLRLTGHLGEFELLRSRSESETRAANASALGLGVERIQLESKMHQSEKSADSARLNRLLAEAEAEIAVTAAEADTLQFEIARRAIRAPVSGSLGDVTILHAGSFVPQGVKLCTVVPEDALKVVAEFPLRAVGRVHSGQPGRLRLLAFPWIEYGSVPVTVTRVGTESTEGDVRVELAIASQQRNVIPIQHGLTGSVQVEVENVSPAGFALRSAGRLLRDN